MQELLKISTFILNFIKSALLLKSLIIYHQLFTIKISNILDVAAVVLRIRSKYHGNNKNRVNDKVLKEIRAKEEVFHKWLNKKDDLSLDACKCKKKKN